MTPTVSVQPPTVQVGLHFDFCFILKPAIQESWSGAVAIDSILTMLIGHLQFTLLKVANQIQHIYHASIIA